jgi:hypothetical protein
MDVWRNFYTSFYTLFIYGFGFIIIIVLMNQIPDTYSRLKRLYMKKKVRGDFATNPL